MLILQGLNSTALDLPPQDLDLDPDPDPDPDPDSDLDLPEQFLILGVRHAFMYVRLFV